MQIRIDHNIEGFAPLLLVVLSKEGWVELLQLQFIYFSETALPVNSDDTTVWRYAQSAGMLLLTSNRNRQDDTSLQTTLDRENHPSALPVITLSDPQHVWVPTYRLQAAPAPARCPVRWGSRWGVPVPWWG